MEAKRGGRVVGARRYTDDMKITVLAPDNPKRPGTKEYQRFALYANGQTVGAYRQRAIAAGLAKDGWGTMSTDVKKGFIKVE